MTLKEYDLTKRSHRHLARKRGVDVPKQKPGVPPKNIWEYIQISDGCWTWNGPINRDGYGLFACNGKITRIHRYILEAHGANLDKNSIVMHICDNPSCCNPDHLKVGTHSDNQKDKYIKNRQAKADACGSSKLTSENVIECRNRYKNGGITYKELAKEFNVCKDTMQKAIRGINWSSI